MNHLRRVSGGEWVSKREMFNAIHAYRIGAGIAERTLRALVFAGEIELEKIGRSDVVRLAGEEVLPSPRAGESVQ